jgi:hypothetical protein
MSKPEERRAWQNVVKQIKASPIAFGRTKTHAYANVSLSENGQGKENVE